MKTLMQLISLCVILVWGFFYFSNKGKQQAFIDYNNRDLNSLAQLQQEAFTPYTNAAATKDVKKFLTTINEVTIPKYSLFVEKLKAIKPENPEVKEVHTLYLEACEFRLEGFRLEARSISENDRSILEQAVEKYRAADMGEKSWLNKFNEYKKKYNIVNE